MDTDSDFFPRPSGSIIAFANEFFRVLKTICQASQSEAVKVICLVNTVFFIISGGGIGYSSARNDMGFNSSRHWSDDQWVGGNTKVKCKWWRAGSIGQFTLWYYVQGKRERSVFHSYLSWNLSERFSNFYIFVELLRHFIRMVSIQNIFWLCMMNNA